MFNICPGCGQYNEEKIVKDGAIAVCPACHYEHHFVSLPLMVVTGSSGSGKSTVALQLATRLTSVVCIESDVLWRDEFNTPENDYKEYRSLWLRVAKNIGQAGRPVVLFGSAAVGQFEQCIESRYFSSIEYLALVCDEAELVARLKRRPSWRNTGSDEMLKIFVGFNRSLIENANQTTPPMQLLDTTALTLEESCERTAQWIEQVVSRSKNACKS